MGPRREVIRVALPRASETMKVDKAVRRLAIRLSDVQGQGTCVASLLFRAATAVRMDLRDHDGITT